MYIKAVRFQSIILKLHLLFWPFPYFPPALIKLCVTLGAFTPWFCKKDFISHSYRKLIWKIFSEVRKSSEGLNFVGTQVHPSAHAASLFTPRSYIRLLFKVWATWPLHHDSELYLQMEFECVFFSFHMVICPKSISIHQKCCLIKLLGLCSSDSADCLALSIV